MARVDVRSKPPDPLEREIQRSGMAIIRGLGCDVHRRNTGAMRAEYKGRERVVRFSQKGAADVWCILPGGRHAEIELKREGERPMLDQVLWLRGRNRYCGAAFWVDSTRILERVIRHLIAGGRIVYLDTIWTYEGDTRAIGGEYDLG